MIDALSLLWADAVRDPDAALLARYAADRDSSAFAVLVHRHGPTVFGVCLRNAGHRQDAEDAFQAVFLLLAQQVGTLRQPELLGHWLYGVAYRVARKARRAALRRRTHEAKAVPRPEPRDSDWTDVAPVLDDELMRLADHYRAAVVLCDVQGLSRTEAAERLGIPEGTLSSRLNAARKKLADRLAKRGVTLSVGVLAVHATAAVSEELASRLAKALTVFHSDGPLPAPLSELISEGVLSMRTKLLALVAAFGLGSVGVLAAWPADEPKPTADSKAKADPPKAEVPKADPPKEDFNRPPRDKRAKLVGKFSSNSYMGKPTWSPDGTRLFVTSPAREVIPDRLKASHLLDFISGFDPQDLGNGLRLLRPRNHGSAVGFANAGRDYITFSTSDGVNSVNELQGSTGSVVGEEKVAGPNFVLEIDREDGTPVAITDDRKFIFTHMKAKAKAWFRVLDGKTGEPLRELVKPVEGEKLDAWTFSDTAERLFLLTSIPKGTRLRAIDSITGKLVWEREIAAFIRPKEVSDRVAMTPFTTLVRSGTLLGLVQGLRADNYFDLDISRTSLVEAATGKDRGTPLAELVDSSNRLLAISADGALAVGTTQATKWLSGFTPSTEERKLVVWHTGTGQVVKWWPVAKHYDEPIAYPLAVTFSPRSHLLVIIETTTSRQGAETDAKGTHYPTKSTLGVWDLSGLLK